MDFVTVCLINDRSIIDIISDFFKKKNVFKNVKFLIDSYENRKKVKSLKPKILIIEKELKHGCGIKFRNNLSFKPFTFYISESVKYVKDAYDINCIDYILKPLNKKKLNKIYKKIMNYRDFIIKQSHILSNNVQIECCNKLLNLKINEIYYITKDGRYTLIQTDDRNYLCDRALNYFESKLKNKNFQKVHKSYLVNLNKVIKIDKLDYRNYYICLDEIDKKIKVGKTYLKKIKEITRL